jgi:transcriptional regulator with XRE-family HTH domain
MMDGAELGRRLRAERTAAGRTIASVAAVAGLSVPYIANLENGRGNPTLAALQRLAAALNVRLTVDLTPTDTPDPTTTEPTAAATRFTRTARFRAEASAVAERTGLPTGLAHQHLLALLTAAQAIATTELSTLDFHRLLDTVVLASQPEQRNPP